MLKDIVASELKKNFSELNIEFCENDGKLIAKIPAKHASWKPISLFDDGHEVTIFYGDLTHTHHNYDRHDVSDETKVRIIVEMVVEELAMVFDDKVEFWALGSRNGMGPMEPVGDTSMSQRGYPTILWSGKKLP